MKKKIIVILIIIFIFLGLFLLLGSVLYKKYIGSDKNRETAYIKNPVIGLSDIQAVASFNESFILYLLASIGASKLHNSPFSSELPLLEIQVGDITYYAQIADTQIIIGKGFVQGEDVIITTSALEAIHMLRDQAYIEKSFISGFSQIELIAGKPELFAKGYLQIYRELIGKE